MITTLPLAEIGGPLRGPPPIGFTEYGTAWTSIPSLAHPPGAGPQFMAWAVLTWTRTSPARQPEYPGAHCH